MRSAQLVVFVDALGPSEAPLFAEGRLSLPHARTLRGVLGYSSGALPTILTGASPSVHGRMCLFARAAGSSALAPLRWLGLLPRVVHERARLRRWTAQVFAAAMGYDGYFALHRVPPSAFASLEVPEREDMFEAPTVGGAPTIFARARDAGLRVTLTSWRAAEADRVQAIEAAPDADLAFLYLSGLDGLLHRHGRATRAARSWAASAQATIDRARVALGRRGRDVETILVGDHGMAEVSRVVDPRHVTRTLLDRAPERFLFVDSTMLRVSAAGVEEETRAALRALPGETLDAVALAAQGAPGDGGYGDLIHLLPEGSIFAPSYVGGRVRGMHGYAREAPSACAAMLADSPLPPHATRLEDVAPLLADRLGLTDRGSSP
jgi:hypothetical protein